MSAVYSIYMENVQAVVTKMYNALLVVALTHHIVAYLTANDPEALELVQDAIRAAKGEK